MRRSSSLLASAALVLVLATTSACQSSVSSSATRRSSVSQSAHLSPGLPRTLWDGEEIRTAAWHSIAPLPYQPPFATPEAAMRFLANAWNRHDMVDLRHVTDPNARQQLIDMYDEASNLRLTKCVPNTGEGDYECYFDHDMPPRTHEAGTGHAEFRVGPARRPGWYMTVFEGCGGGGVG